MGATVLIAEIVLVQVRHGNLGEDLANVCDTRVDPAQLPPSVMKRAVQDGAVATSAATAAASLIDVSPGFGERFEPLEDRPIPSTPDSPSFIVCFPIKDNELKGTNSFCRQRNLKLYNKRF